LLIIFVDKALRHARDLLIIFVDKALRHARDFTLHGSSSGVDDPGHQEGTAHFFSPGNYLYIPVTSPANGAIGCESNFSMFSAIISGVLFTDCWSKQTIYRWHDSRRN
jgi:hypothetical protein